MTHTNKLKHTQMKNTTGYSVEEIGKRWFVVYTFSDNEKMFMSKSYRTEKGVNKRLVSVKQAAGVN